MNAPTSVGGEVSVNVQLSTRAVYPAKLTRPLSRALESCKGTGLYTIHALYNVPRLSQWTDLSLNGKMEHSSRTSIEDNKDHLHDFFYLFCSQERNHGGK